MHPTDQAPRPTAAGFALMELMVATLILLVIAGAMLSGLRRLTQMQNGLSNRAELYSSVRGAIELMQQEISQAGSVALPAPVATTGAVASGGVQAIGVTSTTGMFAGEQIIVDTGANAETVTTTGIGTGQLTADFLHAHLAGVPVSVAGGFATGLVPTTVTNGSTGSVLKLYGDLNDDGNLMYAEYTCDTAGGNLYRNVMPFTATSKPAVTASEAILTNVLPNPSGAPCFAYQQQTVGSNTFVVDVAITLTVRTQNKDVVTQQYQQETASLLNVSPRNIFDTWEMASLGDTSRVQPMPASVQALLP